MSGPNRGHQQHLVQTQNPRGTSVRAPTSEPSLRDISFRVLDPLRRAHKLVCSTILLIKTHCIIYINFN